MTSVATDPTTFALVDAVAAPVAVLDRAGRVSHLNAAAAAVLGLRADEASLPAFVAAAFGPADRPAAEAALARLSADAPPAGGILPAGRSPTVTVEGESPAGDRRLAWSLAPACDGSGRVICTAADVTDRHRLTRALAEGEERLHALVEHSPDFVVFQDTDLRFTWVSRTSPGVAPADVVGRTDADFVDAEEAARLAVVKHRVMRTGETERIEMGMPLGGRFFRFESAVVRRTGPDGSVRGVACYVRDVTERWAAEQELRALNEALERRVAERTAELERSGAALAEQARVLRQGEERYARAAEAGGVGVWELDVATGDLYLSPNLKRMLGYADAELPNTLAAWCAHVHPDDKQRVQDTAQDHLDGRTARYECEVRRRHRSGVYRWFLAQGVAQRDAAGRAQRLVGSETDITSRRASEDALRLSEERFRLLFEQSPMSTQAIAPDGRLLRVNRAWERLWGVTLAAIEGYNFFVDPQLEANGVIAWLRATFAGDVAELPPVPFVPDRGAFAGTTRWVRAVAYPVRDAAGTVQEVVLIQEDVTDRRRAEEGLRLQKSLLEAVGEAAIDGVLAVSYAGTVMWANKRYAEMWGVPPELAAPGASDAALLAYVRSQLADAPGFGARVAHLYEHPDEFGQEEVVLRDGRVFDRYTAPVSDGAGGSRGRVWFFRDVTDRRRAEDALRTSERHHRELAKRNRWLVREVEHRVGNQLAGLIGLVGATRASAANVGAFADAIEARLRAMAEVHKLVAGRGGRPVGLRELVDTALAANRCVGPHAVHEAAEGPDVAVPARQVMPLSMILVEWYTNSCKYGAHSAPGGALRLAWTVAQRGTTPWVELRWREQGGPPVRQPIRPSLGTGLVHEFAARELGGKARMDFGPDGADHVLEFPVAGAAQK